MTLPVAIAVWLSAALGASVVEQVHSAFPDQAGCFVAATQARWTQARWTRAHWTRRTGRGALDAGALDAGSVDAGALDAGSVDAGALDAGDIDSGTADAGSVDAGAMDPPDGGTGVDAGPADGGIELEPLSLRVGCGCSSTHDVIGWVLLVALGAARRTRRRRAN